MLIKFIIIFEVLDNQIVKIVKKLNKILKKLKKKREKIKRAYSFGIKIRPLTGGSDIVTNL